MFFSLSYERCYSSSLLLNLYFPEKLLEEVGDGSGVVLIAWWIGAHNVIKHAHKKSDVVARFSTPV